MSVLNAKPLSTIRVIAADIKLAHSIFALPFALLAAFMAAVPINHWGRFATQIAFVVLAMIAARTVAMLANRLLDKDIDSRNARTAGRALPSGRLTTKWVFFVLFDCVVFFMLICAAFAVLYDNWWPVILGMPVLAWLSVYPKFKRFTSLAHLYLGSCLAISPLAAAMAIEPSSITTQPSLWLIAGMVLCWVAGFDIIYALQDVDVDREQNLYSLPARFGVPVALRISRVLHVIAVMCLFGAYVADERFNIPFLIGCLIVTTLLVYEHVTVSKWGTTKIALAFFTLNGIISCVLGVLGVVDVFV